jgi:hypothetical protein
LYFYELYSIFYEFYNFIQFSKIYIRKTNSEIEKTGNSSGPAIWPKASSCRPGPAVEPASQHASGITRARAPTGHRAQRVGGGAADAGGSGNEV